MPSNNLTVYLNDELATRVAEAREKGDLDPKIVVKEALESALDGHDQPSDDSVDAISSLREQLETVRSHLDAANTIISEHATDLDRIAEQLRLSGSEPTSIESILASIEQLRNTPTFIGSGEATAPHSLLIVRVEYETQTVSNETALLALLDVINEQEGQLVSIASMSDGGFLVAIGWTQTEEKTDD